MKKKELIDSLPKIKAANGWGTAFLVSFIEKDTKETDDGLEILPSWWDARNELNRRAANDLAELLRKCGIETKKAGSKWFIKQRV